MLFGPFNQFRDYPELIKHAVIGVELWSSQQFSEPAVLHACVFRLLIGYLVAFSPQSLLLSHSHLVSLALNLRLRDTLRARLNWRPSTR